MDKIEREHKGWVTMEQMVIFPEDEIVNIERKAFKSESHTLDGSFIVRLTKQTPTIEFVAADADEAEELVKFLNSCKKVRNIEDYRKKGKNGQETT